jgi:hypothetical protein
MDEVLADFCGGALFALGTFYKGSKSENGFTFYQD